VMRVRRRWPSGRPAPRAPARAGNRDWM
jgi:hypothetical protein